MLTARSDTGDVVRGLEVGADDYVVKPFNPVVPHWNEAAQLNELYHRAHDDLCLYVITPEIPPLQFDI